MTARPNHNVTIVDGVTVAAHALNGHIDTNLGAIADKQVAIYDVGTGKFIPINYRLASLDDVNLAGLADGNLLAYDLASTKWTPVAAPSADVGGVYGINSETVAYGTIKSLFANMDPMYQFITPGGGAVVVRLENAGAVAGNRFIIKNTVAFNSPSRLIVDPLADHVFAGSVREYIFDGTNWKYAENGSGDNDSFKFNTAYGNRAMAYNYGCAYGYQAEGYSNGTALGFQANGSMYGVSVGRRSKGCWRSVAIGNEALLNMGASSYQDNIAVGYLAGDNLTTGTNCILIGYDIDNLTATESGFMSIGNAIYARADGGAFGTGTTVSTGKAGIWTNDPKSALSVAGGVQVADDTDAASADKVGTLRYREDANNSYTEMCVRNGASSYIWKVINQETW